MCVIEVRVGCPRAALLCAVYPTIGYVTCVANNTHGESPTGSSPRHEFRIFVQCITSVRTAVVGKTQHVSTLRVLPIPSRARWRRVAALEYLKVDLSAPPKYGPNTLNFSMAPAPRMPDCHAMA